MKIESYNINMQSDNSFIRKNRTTESVTFLSQSIKETQNSSIFNSFKLTQKKVVFNEESSLSIEDRIKKLIIELLLEKFSNKKSNIKLYPNDNLKTKVIEYNSIQNPYSNNSQTVSQWGFTYESNEEYYQKSSIEFSSNATIKTNKGEFNIDLNLSYTEQFYEVHKSKIEVGAVKLYDPLIINFEKEDSSFDNISKHMNFEFDINSNTEKENIPYLKNGAGFLSLDKNSNGIIDNGNELFGANTADGFEELKMYDEDNNNWIDENDSIFKDLRVWEKTENGKNNLLTLSQAGVGAIYLSSITTDFNYSKSIEEENAKLKETSIFLKENGKAGLVTSVDFVV
ncbi:hypothetical protein [Arcobacter sp. LA11]|uniref:hypothetical protein n=1 Tax=Arcobacter sp. LA11 TaxID=1898176 RepID=UPI00093433CD|nr:hypothetical protein [Arcobacter sp. LA11]